MRTPLSTVSPAASARPCRGRRRCRPAGGRRSTTSSSTSIAAPSRRRGCRRASRRCAGRRRGRGAGRRTAPRPRRPGRRAGAAAPVSRMTTSTPCWRAALAISRPIQPPPMMPSREPSVRAARSRSASSHWPQVVHLAPLSSASGRRRAARAGGQHQLASTTCRAGCGQRVVGRVDGGDRGGGVQVDAVRRRTSPRGAPARRDSGPLSSMKSLESGGRSYGGCGLVGVDRERAVVPALAELGGDGAGGEACRRR